MVDDERGFTDTPDVVYARRSAVARNILDNRHGIYHEHWDQIWLDHDLGERPGGGLDTIMPVVDLMCERAFHGRPIDVDVVFVHSMNGMAADDMVRSLKRYGYNAHRVPLQVNMVQMIQTT
jgi:hypothetical protein